MSEQTPYTPPGYLRPAFHCPRCSVYSKQEWAHLTGAGSGPGAAFGIAQGLDIAYCLYCVDRFTQAQNGLVNTYTIWYAHKMIHPDSVPVAPPNTDMNADIQEDYLEAASILTKSPRGAVALLRLCIQKLCTQLGEKGKDLNTDIGNLVKKGLPVQIQQALDIVRVIGNEAVHPGQIDLKDDQDTAITLFRLVNRIAEDRITQPRLTREMFDSLPQAQREAIEKRDQSQNP